MQCARSAGTGVVGNTGGSSAVTGTSWTHAGSAHISEGPTTRAAATATATETWTTATRATATATNKGAARKV